MHPAVYKTDLQTGVENGTSGLRLSLYRKEAELCYGSYPEQERYLSCSGDVSARVPGSTKSAKLHPHARERVARRATKHRVARKYLLSRKS